MRKHLRLVVLTVLLAFALSPLSSFAVDWDRVGEGLIQLRNGGLQAAVAGGLCATAAINAAAPEPTTLTKVIAVGAAGSSLMAGYAGPNLRSGFRNVWGGLFGDSGSSGSDLADSGSHQDSGSGFYRCSSVADSSVTTILIVVLLSLCLKNLIWPQPAAAKLSSAPTF